MTCLPKNSAHWGDFKGGKYWLELLHNPTAFHYRLAILILTTFRSLGRLLFGFMIPRQSFRAQLQWREKIKFLCIRLVSFFAMLAFASLRINELGIAVSTARRRRASISNTVWFLFPFVAFRSAGGTFADIWYRQLIAGANATETLNWPPSSNAEVMSVELYLDFPIRLQVTVPY